MTSTALAVLAYPVDGDHRERPLLAGWILVLAGYVVPLVPLVPLVGYLLRVLDASDRDEPAPGFLVDPSGLLRRGLGGTVLATFLLAGPFLVLLITVYGAMVRREGVDPTTTPTLLVYAGSTVVLLLALLGAYLLPIALFRYQRTGSLQAAFAREWYRGAGTHGAYFAGWTSGAVVLTLGLSLASALSGHDPVGPVVASLVLAYASIVTCHVWGRALARVH